MKTRLTKSTAKRKSSLKRELALSESILKLFPKTSRMGRAEPSRWGMAESRKVRVVDQGRPTSVFTHLDNYSN